MIVKYKIWKTKYMLELWEDLTADLELHVSLKNHISNASMKPVWITVFFHYKFILCIWYIYVFYRLYILVSLRSVFLICFSMFSANFHRLPHQHWITSPPSFHTGTGPFLFWKMNWKSNQMRLNSAHNEQFTFNSYCCSNNQNIPYWGTVGHGKTTAICSTWKGHKNYICNTSVVL